MSRVAEHLARGLSPEELVALLQDEPRALDVLERGFVLEAPESPDIETDGDAKRQETPE